MKHDVSLILLYDRESRFLLQHRTADAWIMPDFWALFGGGIKSGEAPHDAVRRETFEELNYELVNPILVIEKEYREGKVEGRMYVYIEPFYGDKSTLVLLEGQGWGWYNKSEMSKLKMVERDRHTIDIVESYLKTQ